MSRPTVLVGVCGTATEVGKTWVGARVLELLRGDGLRVSARKPVQSFDPDADEATDAEVLATATGEDPETVCPPPRWYETPMAPPMAATALGRPEPALGDLVSSIAWSPGTDIGLVETVGGVRSPVASDGDSRDLVRDVAVDLVLLVADAELGVIDAVRGAVDALPAPTLTILNRFDPGTDLHRRNLRWLRERDGYDVETDVRAVADRLAGMVRERASAAESGEHGA